MQKNIFFILCCAGVALAACEKHDPILPGDRTAIFDTANIKILGESVPNLPNDAPETPSADCPYTQDSANVIRDGDKKIFTGFPTNNSVNVKLQPICDKGMVYAGLSTGEVVKVNPKTRSINWIADVYRPSNMTGGADMVDIVAPLVIKNNYVYAGGLGNAFCKISLTSGAKKWCSEIGTAFPFIVMDNVSFVVGTDNYAYAVRNSDGAVYWRTKIDDQVAPKYENKILIVDDIKINAETGARIR